MKDALPSPSMFFSFTVIATGVFIVSALVAVLLVVVSGVPPLSLLSATIIGFLIVSCLFMAALCLYMCRIFRLMKQKQDERYYKLMRGLTHDFNNLLSPMESYATFLSEDLAPDSQQHEFAESILKAVEKTRLLLQQIKKNPDLYEEENSES